MSCAGAHSPAYRRKAPGDADDDDEEEGAGLSAGLGSSGALSEYASESLAQALSLQGGFGIADKIIKQLSGRNLSHEGNETEAARAAGLYVKSYIAASYLLSGICGAIGAVLSVSLLNGSSTGSGAMLLSVVLTPLLGAVFSRRLVPTITGTLLSVLFIGFLINGFQLTNVSSYWVNGVEGALILFVVATTAVIRHRYSGNHAHD